MGAAEVQCSAGGLDLTFLKIATSMNRSAKKKKKKKKKKKSVGG